LPDLNCADVMQLKQKPTVNVTNKVGYNDIPQFLTLKVHGCRLYPSPVNKLHVALYH